MTGMTGLSSMAYDKADRDQFYGHTMATIANKADVVMY
jgi:hypothetical protein